MKKRILVPALVVGTLLTGSLASAGPGVFGGGHGSKEGDCNGRGQGGMSYEQHEERLEQRLEMLETVLDLSEAQQEQIETLFNQQWQDKQQLREQLQVSRKELREARTADNFNETDFRAKAARQAELKIEMMVAKAKLKQQVQALLSAEQREKAAKLGGLLEGQGKGHQGGHRFGS
jgi:Spy/CpxP family protein refolding chaperone